mmetsp:Transcript_22955/g.74792  ORF Transcript_22955/g.74792 Transcript_22955/m.74792 type:complete len:169 (+) Transcript_22955:77-583(+)
MVYEQELKQAFEFFNLEGRETITRADLQRFMEIFFPGVSAKEVRNLIGNGGMSLQKLEKLLQAHELEGFDPVAEAFQVLDPQGTGYADMAVVKDIFSKLPGLSGMDDSDFNFLLEFADKDGDGRISLEEFAKLGNFSAESDTAARELANAPVDDAAIEKLLDEHDAAP